MFTYIIRALVRYICMKLLYKLCITRVLYTYTYTCKILYLYTYMLNSCNWFLTARRRRCNYLKLIININNCN